MSKQNRNPKKQTDKPVEIQHSEADKIFQAKQNIINYDRAWEDDRL